VGRLQRPGQPGQGQSVVLLPGHYRVFATVDTANSAFWTKLAADSYTLLAQYQAAMNGLVPEWGLQRRPHRLRYLRLQRLPHALAVAMDYMWFCTPEAKTFLQKIGTFVDGKGGVTSTGYANNSAFVGAFADSGIAVSQAKIDAYVNPGWAPPAWTTRLISRALCAGCTSWSRAASFCRASRDQKIDAPIRGRPGASPVRTRRAGYAQDDERVEAAARAPTSKISRVMCKRAVGANGARAVAAESTSVVSPQW